MLSGTGRTLDNLLAACRDGTLPARIVLVIASRPCRGAEIARAAGIETLVIPGVIPASELERILRQRDIAWVALAGYLHWVDIPPAYRGRVVNIHPALLPRFGGRGMYGLRVHQAVLQAGETVSGCTVHLCDEIYDHGPIVLQQSCPVLPDDTPRSLAQRVFELERRAYPQALRQLILGQTGPDTPSSTGSQPALAGESGTSPP